MARNRKNQTGLPAGPALKATLICGFILVCCVGYVWQKKQIAELSKQIKNSENRLATLRDQNDKMRKQIAVMVSVGALTERARDPKLALGLGPPQASQIWSLPEPRPETTTAVNKIDQRYAAGRNGAPELP